MLTPPHDDPLCAGQGGPDSRDDRNGCNGLHRARAVPATSHRRSPTPTRPAPAHPNRVWAPWLQQQAIPSITPERLAAAAAADGGRLWLVAPHPDDEVLGLGGLLAAWAAGGCTVQLAAVTDGGASHPHAPHWTPATLMAARRAESAQAWQRLGLGSGSQVAVHRLQLPDGDVPRHEDALAAALAGLLEPGDAVFCTWRLDGHPDHEASGRAAARACSERGCTLFEYPVWMWQWATPGDARVPWHRLRRIRLSAAQQQRKAHATAAHASQLRADSVGGRPVLEPAALQRWLRDSDYVLLPAQP